MAVVSSVVAAKIQQYSKELQKDILSQNVEIETISDLIDVLEAIIQEYKSYS